MRLRVILTAGVAVSALFLKPASAQEAGETEMILDPVVIQSAQERAQDGGSTATTTTTTREEIDNRLVDSIDDLGRTEEAGVSFSRTGRSVNIRGLQGSRVLTTVDGIRVPFLNDATRDADGAADSFDFTTLSAIDVTRGADPLLGTGALGGVLAVRTLDPDDILLGGRSVGVLTKNGYDSTDQSWFSANATAMRVGDTSMLLQGTYRDGNDTDTKGTLDALGTARTAPNPLDFEQYSLLAKIYQDVEGGHRFGITGEIFDRDEDIDGRTGQTATGNYRAGNYFLGETVRRERVALTYDYETPELGSGWADEARASLYYQNVERETTVDAFRSTSVQGPFTRDNSFEEEAVGFVGNASRGFTMGAIGHEITVGTELRTSTATQYSAGIDSCPPGPPFSARFSACNNLHTNQADTPEVDGALVGVFAQDEISFFSSRFRVTPGIRFDWYEEKPVLTPQYESSAAFDGTLPDASSDTAFSPKLLVEYDLVPDLTAYAQYTAGFRAPTVGELFSRFGAVNTYLRVGNPDLEPERSDGFDVGLRFERENVGAHVNVFTTAYENFIDVVQISPSCFVDRVNCNPLYPQAGVSSYENIPDARISGIELGGFVRFAQGWHARGSFSYLEGRNRTDDTDLDTVPPLTAILGVGYERTEWGTEVSAKLAARRDKVDEGFEAPGYGVVDLTAWYAPEAVPGLKLAGGVFNVFDKTYYDALSVPLSRSQPDVYYSEPGRALKFNFTYQF